jgi:kynureninase
LLSDRYEEHPPSRRLTREPEAVLLRAHPAAGVLPALFSRPGLSILQIGVDVIRRRSLAQTDHIIARADEMGLAVATPRPHERRGGIVALRFPGDAAVARMLVADGFVCSYRGGLRIAPHFYNTDEEVDRFMDELVWRVRKAAA